MKVARIAVNYPLKNSGLLYHYEGELDRGQVVEVPLGKRTELGCVVSIDESSSAEYASTPLDKIKSIKNIVPDWKLEEPELALYEWMAQYYHYGLGQLIFDCLPHRLKRPRPLDQTVGEGRQLEFDPNEAQKDIIEKIKNGEAKFRRYLIHGVTGSGKTIIYLESGHPTAAAGQFRAAAAIQRRAGPLPAPRRVRWQ